MMLSQVCKTRPKKAELWKLTWRCKRKSQASNLLTFLQSAHCSHNRNLFHFVPIELSSLFFCLISVLLFHNLTIFRISIPQFLWNFSNENPKSLKFEIITLKDWNSVWQNTKKQALETHSYVHTPYKQSNSRIHQYRYTHHGGKP